MADVLASEIEDLAKVLHAQWPLAKSWDGESDEIKENYLREARAVASAGWRPKQDREA